ncbi:glycosyltransferase [Halomonas sp. D1-1]|uniref:Glycosyltransferase n=1 Tax=Halomonas icarae TaxID=2691040 RepID=A0A7X5AKS4_9GAMM|nr:glycosyltransferase [Halomonas icarae]
MGKYTIAIVLPDLRGGGAERVNIDLAHEFARDGYNVEFVLMQANGELLQEAKRSFPVVDLDCHRSRVLPLALARYLRQRSPDALIAAMWPLTVIAPVAARLSRHRCRVLVSEHGMLSGEYGDWGRLHRTFLRASTAVGYRLAQQRIGVSSGLVRDMASLAGMSTADFQVIHNPVPPRPEPSVEAIEAAEALWSTPAGGRILTVGTMKAVKNHPLLLRAFAKLERQDARLMFVGDGQGRAALLSLARELGIENRVILAGFHSDPTPFYQTADLFALSSNYEGFGNVIVEAMACGTPVVSTDCPSGPAEILDQGRYGRLVPVGDVNAMTTAFSAALDEPTDTERLRARAADFHPTRAAKAYLNQLNI